MVQSINVLNVPVCVWRQGEVERGEKLRGELGGILLFFLLGVGSGFPEHKLERVT